MLPMPPMSGAPAGAADLGSGISDTIASVVITLRLLTFARRTAISGLNGFPKKAY